MEYKVDKPEKLIKFLIHNVQGLSFGIAQKYLRLGKIKVNGKREKNNIELSLNDIVELHLSSVNKPHIETLYEDENIIIVNKPQGIECATRDKSSENTYSLEELFSDKHAIIVHRLDRLTEGIVIMAKSIDIARKFERYFRLRLIEKSYQALVHGICKIDGIEYAYLKKDSNKSIVQISDTPVNGFKEIITEFHPIREFHDKNYTLMNIKLHTGRTHQIRAHLSHLGYHIIGDSKYSKDQIQTDYKGYFLTAYQVSFKIDDELKYLNDICINITPSWTKNIG